jgi:hypothetical protein
MATTRRKLLTGAGVAALVAAAALTVPPVRRRLLHPILVRMRGPSTVEQRLAGLTDARSRVADKFARAGVAFPPAHVVLLGLKDERRLEVYAGPAEDALRHVADYPVLAASGSAGPKLREGDRQVPEGVYPLESLNPNSRFHVALRVGYPDAFDRETAKRDGRTNLGGDIMIHGGSSSVGCLALGDDAAEELFVVAATTGIEKVTVVLSPVDLRHRPLPARLNESWRADLYADLATHLARLPSDPVRR